MRRLATLSMGALLGVAVGAAPAAAGGGGGICLADSLGPPERTVLVSDNCFWRQQITVRPGQVVRWELRAAQAPHTVTFDAAFDSGDLEGPLAIRFNEPGTYEYFCRYHGGPGSGMVGTVVVQGTARNHAGTSAFEVVEGAPPGSSAAGEEASLTPVAAAGPTAALPAEVTARIGLDPPTVAALGVLALAMGLGIGMGLGLVGRLPRSPG